MGRESLKAVESACLACCARRPRAGLPPVLRAGGIFEENAMADDEQKQWTEGPTRIVERAGSHQSPGMRQGIAAARRNGISVEFRLLDRAVLADLVCSVGYDCVEVKS